MRKLIKQKGSKWKNKVISCVLSMAMVFTMLPVNVGVASAASADAASTVGTAKSADDPGVTKAEMSDATLESLGMTLNADAGEEGDNPYGKGYVNFNPISELYMASSNGKSYVKDNPGITSAGDFSTGTQLSRDNVESAKNTLYSTTVAFNPGTGKDEMVARCSIGTDKKLYLTVYGFNKNKNRVQTASYTIGSCSKIFNLYVTTKKNKTRYRTHQWEMMPIQTSPLWIWMAMA